MATQWVSAFVKLEVPEAIDYIYEVVVLVLYKNEANTNIIQVSANEVIKNLKGSHPSLINGEFTFNYHNFINQLSLFTTVDVPAYNAYRDAKHSVTQKLKAALKLEEFKPRVLSSFVRNKLIDQVYLPLFGDNLSKQLGSVGANKRTDRMGMLLLISPPGYGKTTLLLQYLAWLQAKKARTIWINLEKADNDISRLLQVVSEASNASVSGSSKVATKENPHNTDDLNVLLSAIADNEQPFYLFLDNFDVITEPSTLSILSDALNHLKSHQQIIIASRTAPKLALSKLKIADNLIEVSTSELKFSFEQTKVYFSRCSSFKIIFQIKLIFEYTIYSLCHGIFIRISSFSHGSRELFFLNCLVKHRLIQQLLYLHQKKNY